MSAILITKGSKYDCKLSCEYELQTLYSYVTSNIYYLQSLWPFSEKVGHVMISWLRLVQGRPGAIFL